MKPNLAGHLRDARRSALVMAALAVGLPALFTALADHHARQLDDLANHGVPVTALVSRVDSDGIGYVAYDVDGRAYASSIGRGDAPPMHSGQTLSLVVLPETPTRFAAGDRGHATAMANDTRRLAWQVDLGLLWFFGYGAALSAWQYRRWRRTGRTEHHDRRAYRARLALSAVWLAPFVALIFGRRWLDDHAAGESPWPTLLAAAFTLGIVGGTGWYVMRAGHPHVGERAARIMRWAAPLAIAAASLKLYAWLIAGR